MCKEKESLNIYVHADTEDCIPKQAHPNEWFDLSTKEEVILKKNHFYMIDLGVRIKVPAGYHAILAPRSSTFKKYGIIQTNSIGVIDETYCGEKDVWKMPVYCLGEDSVIPAGTRIAQFRIIQNQPTCHINLVEKMGDENRGGFGSTDKIKTEIKDSLWAY